MTMTIHQAWVKIPTKTTGIDGIDAIDTIDAYEAYPLDLGKSAPAIVVFQEVFGVNSHIRSVVDRLAEAGYRAIAPALYQRTAPGFEVGYSEADLALGRQHKDLTTAPQLLSDIEQTIAYLKTESSEGQRGFGCIGFCFGGHVAYLAATLPEIKATASFYGAGIPTFTPGGGEPTIQRTPDIRGTFYGFYGLADPLIPLEHIDQIEQALEAAQVPHRIFRYPEAGHGFCCDQRSDYQPTACTDAWAAVLELFQILY
jgi:carboxymethylenebutenolidase